MESNQPNQTNQAPIFPNLDVARKVYGLEADATEADVVAEIVRRINALGIPGDNLEELLINVNIKTEELKRKL